MEKKIDSIIDDLCKHEISKQEAKDRLLVLFGVVGRSEQLVCSCGSRLVKTTGGYHCGNAKCSV